MTSTATADTTTLHADGVLRPHSQHGRRETLLPPPHIQNHAANLDGPARRVTGLRMVLRHPGRRRRHQRLVLPTGAGCPDLDHAGAAVRRRHPLRTESGPVRPRRR